MTTYHLLEKRNEPGLVSLIIPCYNEEEVIPILKKELGIFLDSLPCPWEVILINDGSSDKTIELLVEWCKQDNRIKTLSFSRNFGHQIAVTAGLDACKGDAIVILDADLQDPPQVIHKMIAKYREGYDVVYGQREERTGESAFKKFTAWAFYRLMRSLVHKDLPLDTGDFRLLSRQFLEELRSMREMHRYLRGMGTWVGFSQTPVKYKRAPRAAGQTKYPLNKMLKFAWTAAVSFSPLPMRLSLAVGTIVAGFGFCVGIYAVIRSIIHFFFNPPGFTYNPGWATLVTLICLIGGIILVSIGILGEYIGRIYEEIKDRPLYIVKLRKNL